MKLPYEIEKKLNVKNQLKVSNTLKKRIFNFMNYFIWTMFLAGHVGGCPKVCHCMWKSGKEWVTCTNGNFIDIPRDLDTSTQVLNLNHNNLKILFRDAFVDQNLVNLQRVFMSYCKLTRLETGSLRKLTNIIEIDLSSNYLKSVPNEALEDIPGLRELSLKNNSITAILHHAFKETLDLIRLDISMNKIICISNKAFESLVKLEVLDVSLNKIESLDSKVLHPLTSLHGFYVHDNNWNCNCSLKPLRQLMLTRNIASSLPPHCSRPRRLQGQAWFDINVTEFLCKPQVTPIAKKVIVANGDNVSLACRVETDSDASVTWIIGDKAIAKDHISVDSKYRVLELILPNRGRNFRVSNLTISGANFEDQGIYQCVVENKAGRVETNLILKVLEVTNLPQKEQPRKFVMIILLSGGLVIVIATLITTFILLYKRKHRQREHYINNDFSKDISNSNVSRNSESTALDLSSPHGYDISRLSLINITGENVMPSFPLHSHQCQKSHEHLANQNKTELLEVKEVEQFKQEPILRDLAAQCEREIIKWQTLYQNLKSVKSSNLLQEVYPDLLSAQNFQIKFSHLKQGLTNNIEASKAHDEALELKKCIREYQKLQNDLYRMKESAIEGPQALEPQEMLTNRPEIFNPILPIDHLTNSEQLFYDDKETAGIFKDDVENSVQICHPSPPKDFKNSDSESDLNPLTDSPIFKLDSSPKLKSILKISNSRYATLPTMSKKKFETLDSTDL